MNASQSNGNFSNGVWSLPSIAIGATENLVLTCTPNVGTSANTITNTISQVSADQANPPSANDQLSSSITVKNELDIVYSLAASGTTFEEGQLIDYTINALNSGPAPVSYTHLTLPTIYSV